MNNEHLKRDPEILVIGKNTEGASRAVALPIVSGAPKVTHAYANIAIYRKMILDFSGLRDASPAMYQVCRDVINRDQNAALPRGMDRRIAKSSRQVTITYEQPIEHDFR